MKSWIATAILLSDVWNGQASIAQTVPAQTPPAADPAARVAPPPPALPPATKPDDGKQGSLHIRCDGLPPHVTGGETFARFMGAVTLLGLFAPRPEFPAPDKRLPGLQGIDVCTQLIDGPHTEGNGLRRLQLILARAAHRIEAKDYAGAIADVEKARAEAKAFHLVGNPYFDRSFGLSFNMMGAEALYLSGKTAEANDASISDITRMPFSPIPVSTATEFVGVGRDISPTEQAVLTIRDHLFPGQAGYHQTRLAEAGRFSEAAKLADDGAVLLGNFNKLSSPSQIQAAAALFWGLAGDWDKAHDRAALAHKSVDDADAAGRPDNGRAAVAETLDLLEIVQLVHDGKIDDARRNFASRSQWANTNLGAVLTVTHMLRQGARPDQLTGALKDSDDHLWQAFQARAHAAYLNRVDDNKTLYAKIPAYARIDEYEKISRRVWNVGHSSVLSKEPAKDSTFYTLSFRPLEPIYNATIPDALLLHAALLAKSRGYKGMIYLTPTSALGVPFVKFGNPGDADMPSTFYLDADTVIAELRQVIPSPEDIAAREKAAQS